MSDAFDPDFGTALEAAAAIRAKQISSVELTQHTLRRVDAFQPALNAYVYQLREEALAAAARADDAMARQTATGALHGVPVNVKESFGVEGQPCTWGIPPLRASKAPAHGVAVRRLLDAGAILLGATNVPFELMDGQAFNDIYGTSNNPWDLARTPGGSSGGSAASLAAGMAFLSIGSDRAEDHIVDGLADSESRVLLTEARTAYATGHSTSGVVLVRLLQGSKPAHVDDPARVPRQLSARL